jgi:hypothetical protein
MDTNITQEQIPDRFNINKIEDLVSPFLRAIMSKNSGRIFREDVVRKLAPYLSFLAGEIFARCEKLGNKFGDVNTLFSRTCALVQKISEASPNGSAVHDAEPRWRWAIKTYEQDKACDSAWNEESNAELEYNEVSKCLSVGDRTREDELKLRECYRIHSIKNDIYVEASNKFVALGTIANVERQFGGCDPKPICEKILPREHDIRAKAGRKFSELASAGNTDELNKHREIEIQMEKIFRESREVKYQLGVIEGADEKLEELWARLGNVKQEAEESMRMEEELTRQLMGKSTGQFTGESAEQLTEELTKQSMEKSAKQFTEE